MRKVVLIALALVVVFVAPASAQVRSEDMSARLVIDHHKIPSYFIGEWCSGFYDKKSKSYSWQLPSWTDCSDKNMIISVGDDRFYFDGVEYQVTWVNDIPKECAPSGCSYQIHIATSQNTIFVMYRYKGNLSLEQIR